MYRCSFSEPWAVVWHLKYRSRHITSSFWYLHLWFVLQHLWPNSWASTRVFSFQHLARIGVKYYGTIRQEEELFLFHCTNLLCVLIFLERVVVIRYYCTWIICQFDQVSYFSLPWYSIRRGLHSFYLWSWKCKAKGCPSCLGRVQQKMVVLAYIVKVGLKLVRPWSFHILLLK